MLPKSRPSERGLALQAKVDACNEETFAQWPTPTRDDCALIGSYIVLFSYVDMHLRRMAEIVELAGKLPGPMKGKVAQLTIVDVENMLLAMTDWSESSRIALEN